MGRAEERATSRAAKAAVRNLKRQGAVDLKSPPPQPIESISLGYCWNEARGVSGFWHQSVLRLLQGMAGRVGFRPISVEAGPFISQARNMILDRFLAAGDDYLLMTDTDMVFGAEDVRLLLEADSPIAGAHYYSAATGQAPWCTALVEGEDGAYAPLVLPELPEPPVPPEPDSEAPGAETSAESVAEYSAALAGWQEFADGPDFQPRVVAAVGMGLTLVKREVVEAVKQIYNHPFEFVGAAGEDLTFCLRAKEMGFDTVVVPKARVGHVKVTVL